MADAFRGMNEEPGTGLPALTVPPNTPPLMLGVRLTVAEGRVLDLVSDAAGLVAPNKGGLSVSRSWADLPSFTVPKRLKHAYPSRNFRAARGGPDCRIWSHPVPTFAAEPAAAVRFAPRLSLRVDKPGHGLVEPDVPMAADAYEAALADTRRNWTVNEPARPADGSAST